MGTRLLHLPPHQPASVGRRRVRLRQRPTVVADVYLLLATGMIDTRSECVWRRMGGRYGTPAPTPQSHRWDRRRRRRAGTIRASTTSSHEQGEDGEEPQAFHLCRVASLLRYQSPRERRRRPEDPRAERDADGRHRGRSDRVRALPRRGRMTTEGGFATRSPTASTSPSAGRRRRPNVRSKAEPAMGSLRWPGRRRAGGAPRPPCRPRRS